MHNLNISEIHDQLYSRRQKLQDAINSGNHVPQLVDLLQEVDSALERINLGSYGKCLVCHDPIETDRLAADPLITVCLDHMNKSQQKFLEQDLELASQIQNKLLPRNNFTEHGFEISYYYMPAGPVSGDYCDIVTAKNERENLYFILGDITGKGIAASMLVNHMYAMFHSLIELELPLNDLIKRANRLFCESSLYTHFATMVCGVGDKNGDIEICNAGHCFPVLIKENEIISVNSTGLPIGLFCNLEYSVFNYHMNKGESLLIYSDGLSEARRGEEEFGVERINAIASSCYNLSSPEIIELFIKKIIEFKDNSSSVDDMTMMVIKRIY